MGKLSQVELALEILSTAEGAVSYSDLRAKGIGATALSRLVCEGRIVRPASGHYAMPDRIDIMDADWVAFALQVPEGVVGLFSAAAHHDLTQELPPYLQVFVPRSRGVRVILGGDCMAEVDAVASRNPLHLTVGIETVRRSGTDIRVTTKERTALDLFLFSPFNSSASAGVVKVPEESFLDCLKRCSEDPSFSFDTLHELSVKFGCEEKLSPFTKSIRYSTAAGMAL